MLNCQTLSMSQSFLSQLRLTKFILTPEFAGNTTRMNAALPLVNFLLKTENYYCKTIDSKFTNDEKQQVLAWTKTLLKKVKKYIDENLNPAKEM